MPELILLIGPQGSGKSTFFKGRFAATHQLVSKDLLRNNRHPERRQQQLIFEALALGRSVVVDNTHPTVESRAGVIQLGLSAGAVVIAYWFRCPVDRCLQRNARRPGRAHVPGGIVRQTHRNLEPPHSAEGFHQIYRVEAATDYAAVVMEFNARPRTSGVSA